MWGYPGPWSNPWIPRAQTHSLRAIAAANSVAYAVLSDGQLARFNGGGWAPVEGSAAWGISELGMTEDEHVLVIANGKLRLVDHGQLTPLACDAIAAGAVAGTRGDDAFILDQAGVLYLNADGRCDKVDAPARLRRIAARSDRLLAVTVDGAIWRRRATSWVLLPPPAKYRAGQRPVVMQAQDVGVSAYSTWLTDTEGSVFILSDES